MADAPHEAGDPLAQAWAIQAAAAVRGFDWSDVADVVAKVKEETREIEDALASADAEGARRELGDLLFAAVNLARFLDADPVEELHRANARFSTRFALLDEELQRTGRVMEQCSLAEMDEVWEQVKRRLRSERK